MIYEDIPEELRRFEEIYWTREIDQSVKPPWEPRYLPAWRWTNEVLSWARKHDLDHEQTEIMLYQCDPFDDRPVYGMFQNRMIDSIEASVIGSKPWVPPSLSQVTPVFD